MPFYERDSEDSPEARFEVFRNYSGETIVAGSAICIDVASGGTGARIVKPATANLNFFVGIADENAPDGEVFVVQTRGWRTANVRNDLAVAITAGDILIPVAGQWYLLRSGAPDAKTGFIYAAEDYAASNPVVEALKKVYIRA